MYTMREALALEKQIKKHAETAFYQYATRRMPQTAAHSKR